MEYFKVYRCSKFYRIYNKNFKCAEFLLYENDMVLLNRKLWLFMGRPHNPRGPAIITNYNETGGGYIEEYCIKGEIHNTKGPAYIGYDKNGKKYSELYYIKGKETLPD